MEQLSEAERHVRDGTWAAHIAGLRQGELAALEHRWSFWARPAQLPPEGAWRTWLILAGRGFGKTRAGAEWIRGEATAHPSYKIALVGASMAEARQVMVEGPSGLLSVGPPHLRPRWEPSLGRLRWPGGAVGQVYSAADEEGLRGPQFNIAWADEVAKWPRGQKVWDNLAMTMRLGARPRVLATTTPRPGAFLRRLAAGAVVTRGRTWEARSSLPRAFIGAMQDHYGGTRLGRQELDGELIEEPAGAMWPRALLDAVQGEAAPELVRVVVGVDPPAGAGASSDACGIVAAGRDAAGVGWVLEDASVQGLSPDGWARAVAGCAARHGADLVVAEANNGGAMVRAVLESADSGLPVRLVHAARGKAARAEPVSTLYERGRVRHVGALGAVEDELAGFTSTGWVGEGSPDRADALVWALTALLLEGGVAPGLRLL